MRLSELVEVSRRVGATRSRKEKIAWLAELLARLDPEATAVAVAYLGGRVPGAALGVGPALVREAVGGPVPAVMSEAPLELLEVQRELERLATLSGPGSRGARAEHLVALFARATEAERDFLARLLLGELRQGALEGVMAEAVARAAGLPAAALRRAAMLAGDLAEVARVARAEGEAGLARYRVTLFRPLQPMLAETAEDVEDALSHLGRAAFEHKLDGVRVQVHRSREDVAVYTRRGNDVTGAVPELVELAHTLPGDEWVLDGEALALQPDGRPHPFQVTMRRFGRKLDVAASRARLPLEAFFFDVLLADGEPALDRPAEERHAALAAALPPERLVPRLVTADAEAARAFFEEALRTGHEGLVAKSLTAPYEAGRRGRSWLKLKPAHTLDLVVLAVEAGSGRRSGWLSNLHLGARDGEGFAMLGKTFKGLTDQTLAWQSERLAELEVAREGHVVRVRPELVVEIAFDGVQSSPRYASGLALRFARVVRYRPDKAASEAATLDEVRAIHRAGS